MTTTAATTTTTFGGFPREAISFYEGLQAHNDKAYWDANREVYETAVREPIELLTYELSREFGPAKIFRPYRNLRFSKDKTPYKTAQGALASQIDKPRAGRYVEISAQGLLVGGGQYHFERDELANVRRAIDDDVHGKRLQAIKEELEAAGLAYVKPELKTAPRGYPKDHPRIELLRCTRHAALVRLPPATPWLHTPEAKDHVADIWRRVTPLLDWIAQHAG